VLEFVEEGAAAYVEGFGGFGAVEVVVPQRLEDGFAFDCFEVLGVGGQGSARAAGGVADAHCVGWRELGLVATARLPYSRASLKK